MKGCYFLPILNQPQGVAKQWVQGEGRNGGEKIENIVHLWLYQCHNVKYEIAKSRSFIMLTNVSANSHKWVCSPAVVVEQFWYYSISDCFIQRWGPGHFHHRNGHILQLWIPSNVYRHWFVMDRISRFTGGYNTVTLFSPQIQLSEDEFEQLALSWLGFLENQNEWRSNSTGSTSFDSISRFEESM